jgi:hypothetical protein
MTAEEKAAWKKKMKDARDAKRAAAGKTVTVPARPKPAAPAKEAPAPAGAAAVDEDDDWLL